LDSSPRCAAQAAFRAEVDALAEKARAEILPYFKKRNYDYKAGNGTWFISKPAADDADLLPAGASRE
jgi:hypothetical protein